MARLRGNNLTYVKKQNESLIREVVYKYAPISRSEIAEMVSLTPPTITTNISSMIEQGLLKEWTEVNHDKNGKVMGRPKVSLDFIEDAYFTVGVELSPYHGVITLVNLRGKEQKTIRYFSAKTSYQDELNTLAGHIKDLLAESKIDPEKILGIGFGIPGFADRKTGTVRKSAIRCWNDHKIAEDLSALTGYPVLVENNVRVRAVGEEMFGETLRPDTFAYFFVSYGIASPLYIKNSILEGERQGAGEAGHMVAILNGPHCETCGNDGCLEAVASERAILKQIRQKLSEGETSIITEYCRDPADLSIDDVLKAQQAGDSMVNGVVKTAITYLGAALANIINVIYPPLVMVDAALMMYEENQEYFLQETRKHIFGLYDGEVSIEFVPYSYKSGARGAAALAVKYYLIKI